MRLIAIALIVCSGAATATVAIVDRRREAMSARTSATPKPDMKNYALPRDVVDALVAYMASLKKNRRGTSIA